MRRFCFVLSSVLLLFGPGASAAQTYLHCYIGDAPPDAMISTDRNLSGFLTSIQIASLRHGCSLDTGEDKAMLDRRLSAAGCGPTSEVAAFAADTFAPTPAETLAQLRKDSGGNTALITRLCEAAASCAPGDQDYGPECEAGIAAAMGR